MLVDTHAHLHFDAYQEDADAVLRRSHQAGVTKIITVGVNTADSQAAVNFAAARENVWATVGIHPHSAEEAPQGIGVIADLASHTKVVAIGECGLDYFKSQTSKEVQQKALRLQIELAQEKDLPLVFHVRDAYDDFLKIVDSYQNLRGVVHSFTGNRQQMEAIVERELSIAVNGIMTFTKDEGQLDALRHIPLERLLLETDCPFLSPAPNRGKRNEPAATTEIAKFVARLRRASYDEIAHTTTANAHNLFGLV